MFRLTEKKYRVHKFDKFHYSEIGEYVDENHTDKPLRNDEIVDLLNENEELKSKLAEVKKENYGNLDGLAYKDEVEIPQLSERISDLECEIEKLKDDKNYYQVKSGKCEQELLYLRSENERLNKELNSFEPQLFNDLVGEPVTLYKKGDDVE